MSEVALAYIVGDETPTKCRVAPTTSTRQLRTKRDLLALMTRLAPASRRPQTAKVMQWRRENGDSGGPVLRTVPPEGHALLGMTVEGLGSLFLPLQMMNPIVQDQL